MFLCGVAPESFSIHRSQSLLSSVSGGSPNSSALNWKLLASATAWFEDMYLPLRVVMSFPTAEEPIE